MSRYTSHGSRVAQPIRPSKDQKACASRAHNSASGGHYTVRREEVSKGASGGQTVSAGKGSLPGGASDGGQELSAERRSQVGFRRTHCAPPARGGSQQPGPVQLWCAQALTRLSASGHPLARNAWINVWLPRHGVHIFRRSRPRRRGPRTRRRGGPSWRLLDIIFFPTAKQRGLL